MILDNKDFNTYDVEIHRCNHDRIVVKSFKAT